MNYQEFNVAARNLRTVVQAKAQTSLFDLLEVAAPLQEA